MNHEFQVTCIGFGQLRRRATCFHLPQVTLLISNFQIRQKMSTLTSRLSLGLSPLLGKEFQLLRAAIATGRPFWLAELWGSENFLVGFLNLTVTLLPCSWVVQVFQKFEYFNHLPRCFLHSIVGISNISSFMERHSYAKISS